MTVPFAHLSVRTSYSLRDGTIRPRELAVAAAEAGMSHVAVTDRDGLYGAVRVAQACAATGVTPVFGADLALEPDPDRPGWGSSRGGRVRREWESRPAVGPAWLEGDAPRITFLARTQRGYGGLCRTVSAAHRDQRSDPHLTWEDATVHPEGRYVLLGVDSPVGRLLADGATQAAEAEVVRWVGACGADQVLLAVRDHRSGLAEDLAASRTVALADRLGLTAVAVNDVRYLRERDAYLADVMACVRAQVPVAGHHLDRSTAEGWLKTADDLLTIPRFRDRPDLLRNAQRVAGSCEVDLGLHAGPHAPRLTGLDDVEARRELHARCRTGVRERYDRPGPEVSDRLVAELAMVDQLGLHDYFLAVAEIVRDIRDAGILTACRGSAAGSLICYALRISDVDPVAHGLLFERFMNPYRDELPDIDIDVESARREDVYRMVMGRYGDERTACVAMVETFQARMAVRETGKVLGLPPEEINLIAKAFRQVRARDIRAAMRELPELAGTRLDAGQLEMLFQVVERIDGFPRHLALHPCGIVLGDGELLDRAPVERSANGFSMVQFDKDDVAALGLLKLDVLAVRLLSAMRHALDLTQETRGRELTVEDIGDDDPGTYELLRSTRSVGVFQVESPGQRELLGRLQPDTFGDLITEISLFRPGPVKADMVGPFVARRTGEEQGEILHPLLEPVLGETFGVVVYHEQVMEVVAALTGCDLAYADLVRRELADEGKLAARRVWALNRARERGFDRATAEAIWKQVASFASFGFCKAHAAAFAVPTYRSAWMKVHLLPELVAGLLTHDPGMYPRRLILDEARQFGIAVLGPDVNVSRSEYTVERVPAPVALASLGVRPRGDPPPGWTCEPSAPHVALPVHRQGQHGLSSPPCEPSAPHVAFGVHERVVPPSGWDLGADEVGAEGVAMRWAVRVGLQDVKAMSEVERERLLTGRAYTSLEDLRVRGGLSRLTAENLCKAGALDALSPHGPDRRRTMLAVEELWAGTRRTLRAGGQGSRAGGGGDVEVHQTSLDLHADHEPQLPPPTDAEAVRDELEVLELDWSRHVVAFYEPLFEVLGVTRAYQLLGRHDGEVVRVAGVRVALQSPPVRSGQRVLFLSLDDRTGTTQCNFFESVLGTEAWTVLNSWLVVVEGRLRRSGPRGASILAERAWDLSELWRAWGRGQLDAALARRGPPAPHRRAERRPAGLSAAMFASGSR
ncbi:MAG: DNA polymerase III subunit alpha [Actinobacteria bacterium]|nr:DNA polymerase III subunit alpha [Actinomycetota bacterium]